MNVFDLLHGLARRWYITVPGVIVALALGVFAWNVTPPEQSRSSSLLLLPGPAVLPEGSANRFLFMGGLTPVADVLIRATTSEPALVELSEEYPGTQIEVTRDQLAAGPVILVTVTSPDETHITEVISAVVDVADATLERLQREDGIPSRERVTMTQIAVDQQSTLRERNRIVVAVGAALVVVVLTVVLASVIEGFSRRSRGQRRKSNDVRVSRTASGPPPDDTPDAADHASDSTEDAPGTAEHASDNTEDVSTAEDADAAADEKRPPSTVETERLPSEPVPAGKGRAKKAKDVEPVT